MSLNSVNNSIANVPVQNLSQQLKKLNQDGIEGINKLQEIYNESQQGRWKHISKEALGGFAGMLTLYSRGGDHTSKGSHFSKIPDMLLGSLAGFIVSQAFTAAFPEPSYQEIFEKAVNIISGEHNKNEQLGIEIGQLEDKIEAFGAEKEKYIEEIGTLIENLDKPQYLYAIENENTCINLKIYNKIKNFQNRQLNLENTNNFLEIKKRNLKKEKASLETKYEELKKDSKLSKEENAKEINSLKIKNSDLLKKLIDLQNDNKISSEIGSNLIKENDDLAKSNVKSLTQLSMSEIDNKNYKNINFTLVCEVYNLKKDKSSLQIRINELQNTVSVLQNQNNNFESSLEDSSEEINTLRKSEEELLAQKDDLEQKNIKAALALNQKEEENVKLQLRCKTLEGDNDYLRSTNDKISSQFEEVQKNLQMIMTQMTLQNNHQNEQINQLRNQYREEIYHLKVQHAIEIAELKAEIYKIQEEKGMIPTLDQIALDIDAANEEEEKSYVQLSNSIINSTTSSRVESDIADQD